MGCKKKKSTQCSKWCLSQISEVGVQSLKKFKGSLLMQQKSNGLLKWKDPNSTFEYGSELMLDEFVRLC